MRGLTVSGAASFGEAKLTQDFPPCSLLSQCAVGVNGNPLPFSSRFTGSLSAEQEIRLVGGWTAVAGGTLTYVGSREGEFPAAGQLRARFPAYANFDLHSGIRFDTWTTSLFATNIANRRGIVGGGISYAQSPYDTVYIQPRTIGLSVIKTF
jgi:hypothetical protein